MVPPLKHIYNMRNVIPNYIIRRRATYFKDIQVVNDLLVCVCVGGGGVGYVPVLSKMTDCQARRKRIDYAHDLSDLFHSVGWFKNGDRPWRSIYFRQDLRKVLPPFFPHKIVFTIQFLQRNVAMRPEDDSCMDKVIEMYHI